MLDLMYTHPVPGDIQECVITEEVVVSRAAPITLYKKAG